MAAIKPTIANAEPNPFIFIPTRLALSEFPPTARDLPYGVDLVIQSKRAVNAISKTNNKVAIYKHLVLILLKLKLFQRL